MKLEELLERDDPEANLIFAVAEYDELCREKGYPEAMEVCGWTLIPPDVTHCDTDGTAPKKLSLVTKRLNCDTPEKNEGL